MPPSRYSLQAASRCQPAACVQRLELMQAYRKAAVKVIGGPSDLKKLLRCASVCSSDAHKLRDGRFLAFTGRCSERSQASLSDLGTGTQLPGVDRTVIRLQYWLCT